MLVVDSSVWIDFFNGRPSSGRAALRGVLDSGELRVVVPDLVLYEVLRGFRHERDLRQARALMQTLAIEDAGGEEIALAAAHEYRSLRAQGITIRSPVDVIVATFCLERDYALLHSDRDFDAFAKRRGLRVWQH